MVKQALTSETVKDALASKEILAFLYTKRADAWNRYMQDSHPNLTSLDLWGSQIGDEGAKALAGNNTLTSLNLGYNKIGDQGAKALAANNTLASLDLRDNKIGAKGAKALIKGLEANKNLLKYEGPGKEGLAEHIKNNRETAMRYVEQLMEQKDHASISAADKTEIAARANAIRQLAEEREDMSAEQQQQLTETFAAICDAPPSPHITEKASITPAQSTRRSV